ncbi:cereblon family protein [Desulfohalobium retbaense]|jgi:hypothetical protein|uniref:CULT domain-containing protein n=1 Tax=Desulfohalobium retbaense (strain ATCC 49708 / DSM 5692 / JCM 16813 / HR100) TaxID=485915 RepID=C8X0Q6_DESRD|nr:cereblon family protein [Desulfohalobium retbaense]ACV68003.1 hypothetical protein Dret_0711 [Desulfohalobium retbaense DSM 5692]
MSQIECYTVSSQLAQAGARLLRDRPEQRPSGPAGEATPEQAALDASGRQRFLCRHCKHPITTPQDQIVRKGAHEHVFFNPHGFVFEIGCFARAPGCSAVGRPTLEFTWFPGFAWRITLCSQCQRHLGWRYEQTTDVFFGLLLDQLVLETDSNGPSHH